jgi:hypothetical protein
MDSKHGRGRHTPQETEENYQKGKTNCLHANNNKKKKKERRTVKYL